MWEIIWHNAPFVHLGRKSAVVLDLPKIRTNMYTSLLTLPRPFPFTFYAWVS